MKTSAAAPPKPRWLDALVRRDSARSPHHFSGLRWPTPEVTLSVQASKHHHGKPQETLPRAADYEGFEVILTAPNIYKAALLGELGSDKKYLEPAPWDGGIIAGVPARVVERLIKALVELHGAPEILS